MRKARDKLRLTQAELAEALGMQRNSIARMENGRQAILRTTELSIRYLLSTMSNIQGRKRHGSK